MLLLYLNAIGPQTVNKAVSWEHRQGVLSVAHLVAHLDALQKGRKLPPKITSLMDVVFCSRIMAILLQHLTQMYLQYILVLWSPGTRDTKWVSDSTWGSSLHFWVMCSGVKFMKVNKVMTTGQPKGQFKQGEKAITIGYVGSRVRVMWLNQLGVVGRWKYYISFIWNSLNLLWHNLYSESQ